MMYHHNTLWTRVLSVIVILCIYVTQISYCHFDLKLNHKTSPNDKNNEADSCFCEIEGSVGDCHCNVNTVDHFNNIQIYPRLSSIVRKNYFRFYRVKLNGECPFWPVDNNCVIRHCQVENCEEHSIPKGLIDEITKPYHFYEDSSPAYKYSIEAQKEGCSHAFDFNTVLSSLDTHISPQTHKELEKWARYDEAEDDFCILDDHDEGAQYVDLLINPERYTGYKGDSAHRIWNSIYLENCFGLKTNRSNSLPYYTARLDWGDMCVEQRAFYRMISGLHTSINIHLSANYLISGNTGFLDTLSKWAPNIPEFKRRFSSETTNGQGPYWLKNLYFIYLVELRALAKAAPYLRNEPYYTGVKDEDKETKIAIEDLLEIIESFPSHFDEDTLFTGSVEGMKFKHDFKEKFRNISRIMDCVGCSKCKLWGKLQTQGLGTALKILYSEKLNQIRENGFYDKISSISNSTFRLKRTEIVALFNAFARLSNSIVEIDKFRNLLR